MGVFDLWLDGQRLHDDYFPTRSGRVLSSIISFVNIDDLEALQEEILGIGTAVTVPAYDDRYYNLQGQPVAFPTPGLYIYRGRKVLVK